MARCDGARAALVCASFSLCAAVGQAADTAGLEQRYAAVTQWQGTLVVEDHGGWSNDCNGHYTQNIATLEERAVAKILLVAEPNEQKNRVGVFRWVGGGTVTVFRDAWYSHQSPDGSGKSTHEVASGDSAIEHVEFELDVRRGVAGFWNGTVPAPGIAQQTTIHSADRETDRNLRVVIVESDSSDMGYITAPPAHFAPELPWSPSAPGPLSFYIEGGADLLRDFPLRWSCLDDFAAEKQLGSHRARLWLVPVPEDLELIVHIDGTQMSGALVAYDKWLPEGVGVDGAEPKPGARLTVGARLQDRNGKPATVEVKQMRFELHDTSTEPGVSMNSPMLEMTGEDWTKIPPDPRPDLRFDAKYGPVEKARDLQKQIVQPRDDADGAPTANTVVEAYDFGAWADLVVVAQLADGREITGRLDIDRNLMPIPLPKRSNASKIADVWRDRYHTTAADSDDSEKTAIGEPGCNGDGLTLYEEYRGLMINGRHERLDPGKKDLMIYNRCAALAEPGIALFQQLSGIKVHANLLADERNFGVPPETHFGVKANQYTAINAYTHRGPHRVNQHRIDITSCGDIKGHGGSTRMLYPAVRGQERHGRPFLVDSIVVETPEAEFWHEQYGVRATDQPRQFDVAMAHELFHAVGVEHHGEYDFAQILDARAVGDPNNATSHAGWFEHRQQEPVYRLFDERSGRDISEEWANAAVAYVNSRLPNIVAENPSLGFHTKDGVNSTVQLLHVGRPQGEHSGDASCIMRYWLADAYVKRGEPNAYYIVPDGTEPVGSKICRTSDGTDINRPGRLPQPRYFDAHPSRGRCSDWICINDAVAPKSASIPYTPPSP